MPTIRSPHIDSPVPGSSIVELAERTPVFRHTTAISLHSHTNRSRESAVVIPRYLDRIPVVGALARRELRAYERRHNQPVDFARGWWRPPVRPEDVLTSEQSQIVGRLGLRAIVSITDHDSIEAPLALQASTPSGVLPLSVEWTVPFGRGFLHLGVHNLPRGCAEEFFQELSSYTANCDERQLPQLLRRLHECPETLLVLNHPMWDLAGVGSDEHAALLRRFLAQHGGCIHAIEVNGYRSWPENLEAVEIARAAVLPIVSGGDRHGRAPNAVLNLTSARSFGEFAVEVREERRSVVLIMPEYRQPLVSRKLAVASDALRAYPTYPAGERHWTERVIYSREGELRRLSEHWPHGGPFWVRSATRLFGVAAAEPLLPALRLAVWMAGASMSARAVPSPTTEGQATLDPRTPSFPETIG
jgi:hypothetical protein